MTNVEDLPQTIAQNASQQGTFSLIDRLLNRNMPTEEVSIFIDEAAQWDRVRLEKQAGSVTDAEELDDLEDQIADAIARVRASEVVFTIRAISSERYDELIDEAKKRYPVRYEKVTNPLNGRTTHEEIPSADRDTLFNQLYLAECIVQVRMGNDVDANITPEWVESFEKFAPLDALRVVTTKAYKMRMVGEWMDEYQSEDFLPKP
jgi:hypothetical protein